MAWSYYIYYRVDAGQTIAAAAAVKSLLAAVLASSGIQGRVLTKRNEPQLWMEIYEHVADEAQFEWALAEAVAASGIAAALQAGSARHTECFVE